jgi:cellulose synthase/poly-beta-1,6-N-acetylglucosamine synthase-like glycosyltransferase
VNISIIIPCRNEEKYIDQVLKSVVNQDYPRDQVEVFVIDGMSEDGTRDILKQYSEKYSFIKIIDNTKKIVSSALNIGIRNAKGDVIIRMDAHSIYEKLYISKCIKYLYDFNVDNVGGIWVTLSGVDTITANAIVLALSHPFGVGNSYFRIGSKEPRYVDTVPFGCYKREVFDRIGFFDEDLIRNQDDEFNLRLIKSGGKILLVPEIVSHYFARESVLKLWRMYFQYGYFKPLVVVKIGAVLTWRQLVPASFVFTLAVTGIFSIILEPVQLAFILVVVLYLVVNVYFSLLLALKKGLKYFCVLPCIFVAIHFSYGTGYIKGVWDFIISKKHKKNKFRDIILTR